MSRPKVALLLLAVAACLVAGLSACETRPRVLVSASGVNYYGPRGDEPIAEDAAPGDDFHGATVYGGRIYMVTDEVSTSNTEVWSVPTGAATLPVAATLDLSFTGLSYCDGIARDAMYYYFACYTGDQVIRVPVAGGAYTVVTDRHIMSSLKNAVRGNDLDADGVFDVLYVQSSYVCGPASAAAFSSVLAEAASPKIRSLADFGGASSNYGLGYDRAANVLWAFDDDTFEMSRCAESRDIARSRGRRTR